MLHFKDWNWSCGSISVWWETSYIDILAHFFVFIMRDSKDQISWVRIKNYRSSLSSYSLMYGAGCALCSRNAVLKWDCLWMVQYNELHTKYLIMWSFMHNKNYKDYNTFKKIGSVWKLAYRAEAVNLQVGGKKVHYYLQTYVVCVLWNWSNSCWLICHAAAAVTSYSNHTGNEETQIPNSPKCWRGCVPAGGSNLLHK